MCCRAVARLTAEDAHVDGDRVRVGRGESVTPNEASLMDRVRLVNGNWGLSTEPGVSMPHAEAI